MALDRWRSVSGFSARLRSLRSCLLATSDAPLKSRPTLLLTDQNKSSHFLMILSGFARRTMLSVGRTESNQCDGNKLDHCRWTCVQFSPALLSRWHLRPLRRCSEWQLSALRECCRFQPTVVVNADLCRCAFSWVIIAPRVTCSITDEV
jgi:hypothetical protein